jgi:hypothetical protein
MNCKRKMNINLTDLQSVTVDDGVCDVTRSVLTSELLTPDFLVWGLNVSPPPQARRPANHHPSLRDAVRRGEWRGGRGQARDPGAQARVRRRHNSLWWSPAELHDEYTPTIYSKTQLTVQKDGGCTVRSTGREFGCSVALSTMIGVTIYAHFLTLLYVCNITIFLYPCVYVQKQQKHSSLLSPLLHHFNFIFLCFPFSHPDRHYISSPWSGPKQQPK